MCARCKPNDCDCGSEDSDPGGIRDGSAELSQRRMLDDDRALGSCACERDTYCERCRHNPASYAEERADA